MEMCGSKVTVCKQEATPPVGRDNYNMSRFLSTLEGAGGLDIIREVYIGTEKYLLFTRYAEADSQWQIG
jgi:hypothetical protein